MQRVRVSPRTSKFLLVGIVLLPIRAGPMRMYRLGMHIKPAKGLQKISMRQPLGLRERSKQVTLAAYISCWS